jgi:hypothetical protein
MALDANDHEVLHEVVEMEGVADAEYVESVDGGMPSRLYVRSESDVDVLSVDFQEWLLESGVAVMNAGRETEGVYDELYVELQDVGELVA